MSQEQRQQAARNESLVSFIDRVKISAKNMRIEPTMPQKEETFQVFLDIIKASPCFKAFTITADVPTIYMQQFWFTIKKTKKTPFYEFGLADKFSVDVELLKKILDICLRFLNEYFVAPHLKRKCLPFSLNWDTRFHWIILLGCLSITCINRGELWQQSIPSFYLARRPAMIDFVNQEFQYLSDKFDPEPAKRQTRSRRSRDVIIQDTTNVPEKKLVDHSQKLKSIQVMFVEEQLAANMKKVIKASKEAPRIPRPIIDLSEGDGITPKVLDELSGKLTTSNKGAGIVPEVPDEGKGRSITKADAKTDWGLKDNSHQFDDEYTDEGEITWLSADEEEKAKKDDDKSIDIAETYDERTESKNDDQEMIDAEKIVGAKLEEEKVMKKRNKRMMIKLSRIKLKMTS
nr:hypothetical protein [Tanacetum cinerariifolium]